MKSILYFFFFNLLLSNACLAHFIASIPVGVQTVQKQNVTHFDFSQNTAVDYKNDVLIYFYDNDEYECDEQETSLKVKLINLTKDFSTNNKPMVRYMTKVFYNKIHSHINFSRLPRFDYISLKVLRL